MTAHVIAFSPQHLQEGVDGVGIIIDYENAYDPRRSGTAMYVMAG
jgi:hypothetical protein